MRWLLTAVVLVALLGCPGNGTNDGGSGGGMGGGGGGGGSNTCAPAGVWQLDYSGFAGEPGCKPPQEVLVVAALADGGFSASFGLHTYNSCGGAAYYVPSSRTVSFDAGSCALTLDERSMSCWSGESQSNERTLDLHFSGDTIGGSGSGDACPTVGPGPQTVIANGHRLPNGGTGAGGGDGCAPPVWGTCDPVGTWTIAYRTSVFSGCTPADETLTITTDGGAIEASLALDAGAACAPGVFFQPLHQDQQFDEARCELTLTTGVTWCDGPDGGVVHQDQRSVVIDFNGDAGVGTGIALSDACSMSEVSVCVGARR